MKQILRKIGIIAGTVVMAGVAAPLLIPLPPLEGTVPPEDLADSDSCFIPIGTMRIHCKKTGAGRPVFILLHGYLGSTYSWRRIFDPLSRLGTVIAYDRPAFGLTSRPMPGEWKGTSPYGFRGQAQMVIQLMDALGVEQAILIGHGMGASDAVLATQLYPRRVERLVLVDPDPPGQGLPGWQRLFMTTPQLRRLGPVLLRSRVIRQIDGMLKNTWRMPEKTVVEMREEYEKILRVNDWDRSLWELARVNEPWEKLVSLDAIQAPSLVIARDSEAVPRNEEIARLAAAIPNAHLALIPDTGRVPHEETPVAFMQALDEFLKATGSRTLL
jgi:pimeloyl-ACP methyl ester carboxylesterase